MNCRRSGWCSGAFCDITVLPLQYSVFVNKTPGLVIPIWVSAITVWPNSIKACILLKRVPSFLADKMGVPVKAVLPINRDTHHASVELSIFLITVVRGNLAQCPTVSAWTGALEGVFRALQACSSIQTGVGSARGSFFAVGWDVWRLALALIEGRRGRDDTASMSTFSILANIFD